MAPPGGRLIWVASKLKLSDLSDELGDSCDRWDLSKHIAILMRYSSLLLLSLHLRHCRCSLFWVPHASHAMVDSERVSLWGIKAPTVLSTSSWVCQIYTIQYIFINHGGIKLLCRCMNPNNSWYLHNFNWCMSSRESKSQKSIKVHWFWDWTSTYTLLAAIVDGTEKSSNLTPHLCVKWDGRWNHSHGRDHLSRRTS